MGKKRQLGGELAGDELECVLRKLSFVDILRSKRVCRGWLSVAETYESSSTFRPCFQAPWLMLPAWREQEEDCGDVEGERSVSFFNLNEKKEYKNVCKNQQVSKGRCVGSSNGWLVLLGNNADVSVFNPFAGVHTQVGSMKEYLDFTSVHAVKESPRAFVPKAVVMSDSKFNINGVVLMYRNGKKLAFCSCRDGRFMDLDGAHTSYQDITCRDNMLSALSETGSVEIWDFNGPSPAKIMDMEPPFPSKTANFGRKFRDLYSSQFYLVELSGELVFVVRFIGEFVDENGKPVTEADLLSDEDTQPKICPYKTLLFHVYRLDKHEEKWVEMESLGDQIVFLGGSQSLSLSAGDCPGCVKDSIYFTDSYWEREDEDYSYGGHDMGFYSLRDGSVKPFYETPCIKMKPPPFWILPDPVDHCQIPEK